MAFPQVQSVAATTAAYATSDVSLNMPAGIVAGDLLIAFVSYNVGSQRNYTTPTGWRLLDRLYGNTSYESYVYCRVAAGSDTCTLDRSAGSGAVSARVYRVDGWYGTLSGTDDTGDLGGVEGIWNYAYAAGDPSALNPTNWGAEDTLWMVAGVVADSISITSYPLPDNNGSTVSAGVSYRLGVCSDELNQESLDPAAFGMPSAAYSQTITIAIRPEAAADVTAPILSSPDFVAADHNSGTASVTTDEANGTLYTVVTTSATSPSVAQVKAGQDHTGSAAAFDGSQAVSATGNQNVSVTGLSPSTTYYPHFVHTDAATNDSTVATDATGDTTSAAPDVTAPTLTTPDFVAADHNSGTASVSTDEDNGTLYCVVTTSATSPSVAQVKAGQDHTGAAAAFNTSQAVSATGNQNVSVTGLSASTTYYPHFVHTDAATNDSTVATDATGDTTDPAPDVTAPTLSSPAFVATAETTGTASVSTDEDNGTLYTVVTTSSTSPSVAQVKAGQDHTGSAAMFDTSQAVSATGSQNVPVTGLTGGTAYYAHFVHTDAAANDSTVATDATGDTTPEAPVITVQPSNATVTAGQQAQFSVTATGSGTLTYQWQEDTGGGFSNISDGGAYSGATTDTLSIDTVRSMNGYDYRCNVSDDDAGPTTSNSAALTVDQAVLALSGTGYEFGEGNDPATMSVVASTELQVAVYPLTEWPPDTAIATLTASTDASGNLTDLGDDDLLAGTSYRVIARNAANAETWAWVMVAS